MSDELKQHIPAIVVIYLVGVATCAFALMQVHSGVQGLDVNLFSTLIIVIPCAALLICSFLIAFSAPEISRPLYVLVLGASLALGFIAVFVTSSWMSNAEIAAQLVANSPEGTELTPVLRDPFTLFKDVAAFVVVPTIGCIAGAWVGSRVHPMNAKRKKRK